jgi:hypothetical protein
MFVGGTLAPFVATGSEDSCVFNHVEKRTNNFTFGDGRVLLLETGSDGQCRVSPKKCGFVLNPA